MADLGIGAQHQQGLDPSYLEGCASLLDQIDKRVLVVLRDNRNVIGILRTCDQFNNLVLNESVERIHVEKEYAEVPLGIFVVRGDNVLLIGEMDEEKEGRVKNQLKQVPSHLMLMKKRQYDEQNRMRDAKKYEAAKVRGMAYQQGTDCDD